MAVPVRFEAGPQCPQQVVALLPGNAFRFGHLYTLLRLLSVGYQLCRLTLKLTLQRHHRSGGAAAVVKSAAGRSGDT